MHSLKKIILFLALEAALRLGDKVKGVAIYDAAYAGEEEERADYEILAEREFAGQDHMVSTKRLLPMLVKCFKKNFICPCRSD